MRVIGLAVVLSVGLLVAPLAAEAQSAEKVYRIGWLSPPSAATGASELDALREGLRQLNYVEGRNITIEARWADGDPARLPELARGSWNSRWILFAPPALPRRSPRSRRPRRLASRSRRRCWGGRTR
jgi:hypothetical protein